MQICKRFIFISLTTSSLYTQSTFSNFNEQLVYENIVLVCIFIHSSLYYYRRTIFYISNSTCGGCWPRACGACGVYDACCMVL